MAVIGTIDPDWVFKVNQITRILEKAGAKRVVIERDTPRYPGGYIIMVAYGDLMYEAASENLVELTKSMVRKLKEQA